MQANKWLKTFDIQDIWRKRNGECGPEDWTDSTVHELAKEISRRLKRKFPNQMIDGNDWDPNLSEIVDWFDNIQTHAEYLASAEAATNNENIDDDELSHILEYRPLKEFNTVMDLLYDWADRERVWVNK